MHSRSRHEGSEAREKVQRLEANVRPSGPIRRLHPVAHFTLRRERDTFHRHRGPRHVAGEPLELIAFIGFRPVPAAIVGMFYTPTIEAL
jgi:hypothetical protein